MTIDNPEKKTLQRPAHASELPIYQRKVGIQPAAAPSGFTQATEGLSKSYEMFGAMSAKIASDASQQRAQMQGIKFAQENPELQAGIALNESSKAFNDAFRAEKYKVLGNQAESIASKINLEYSKILNPTGKDLELYKKNMTDALGDVLSMADPKSRGDLERAFEQTVNAGMSQLALKVENANLNRLKDNATIASKNNLTNIVDYYRLGMPDAAAQAYGQERANIESSREILGDAVTQAKIDSLDLTRDTGIYGGQMMRLQAMQGTEAAAKYFNNFVENRPEGMTPSRHEQVAAQLYAMESNHLKQLGIDQSIENSKAELELIQSEGIFQPDKWEDVKTKVSPQQYNHLLIKSLQMQQSSKDLTEDMNFVLANGKNVVAMSKMPAERVNKVFDGFMKQMEQYATFNGMEFNPILDGANIAANIGAPISKYTQMLDNAVLFADDVQASMAGEAIKKLQKENPIALKSLSKDAKDISSLFNSYRLNTAYTGAEALQQAKNDIYNVSDEERVRRAAIFTNEMKVNRYDADPDKWADHVAEGIGAPKAGIYGFRKYMMPTDLPAKARGLLASYVERFGNFAKAEEEMFKDLNDVYKTTDTNNRQEKMALPPEVALKDVNIGQWEKNDKALSLYRFVKQNEAAKAQPNSFIFNKVEWPNNPFDSIMQIDGKPITFNGNGTMSVDGELITAEQFYNAMPDSIVMQNMVPGNMELVIDGVKRKVIIQSDEITQLSADNLPSWKFNYLDENGVPQPIMGVDKSGGDVRWYPNMGLLNNQKARIPKWMQDEANIQRQLAENTRQDYLDAVESGISGATSITSSLYGDDLLTGNAVPKKDNK
jgi:hypothetical protein